MENEEHLQQHPQQQHNSTVQPDDGEVYVLFIIKLFKVFFFNEIKLSITYASSKFFFFVNRKS